jgi:hypothetical protein
MDRKLRKKNELLKHFEQLEKDYKELKNKLDGKFMGYQ